MSHSKKSTAKKSTAKKATAKKATAKKSTAKKSTAKKSTAKKSTAKKSTAKKTTAKKSTAKKENSLQNKLSSNADNEPSKLESLLEFYNSEELSEWISDMVFQPPLDILVAMHLTQPAATNEAEKFLLETLQLIIDLGFDDIPEFEVSSHRFPGFSQPTKADLRIIDNCTSAFTELMNMDAYSMIKYEFEDQQMEPDGINEWPIGVLVEDDEGENLSFIPWDDVDFLYDAILIKKRAINIDNGFLPKLKKIEPRLLDVLEINRLATNADLDRKIVERYGASRSTRLRAASAQHNACSLKLRKKLAQDVQPFVRLSVASHLNTPFETLLLLALDSMPEIRSRISDIHKVATNPNTPLSILEVLARDANHNIRGQVAVNPATPFTLLRILATDTARFVRHKVLENPQSNQELKDLIQRQESSAD